MSKTGLAMLAAVTAGAACTGPRPAAPASLWQVYEQSFRRAKYIDLTHAITPTIPVWPGFGDPTFGPTVNPKTGQPYTYEADGFSATRYLLPTDQLGTQLDPPAHWDPNYPTIDELPPTFAVRPLVVISIVDSLARWPGYHLSVADIEAFESAHGRIPEGAVVFVRSDWSRRWNEPGVAEQRPFPGVSLAALRFLHEQRKILFHGHEPLDTDTTATLEGESWLMHHGYAQAEGVAHLDRVPPTGCLVAIGYPKFKGGVGGYARYVAICPPEAADGVTIDQAPGAPLPRNPNPLHWDSVAGLRVR